MIDDEESHKQFLLAALRKATAHARSTQMELDAIGVALDRDLIGTDTAVSWINGAGLMWLVGPLPVGVGEVAKQNETSIVLQVEDAV